MWRFKTVTKFKNSFFPGLIYWNHNRIHLGFWESWFGPPPNWNYWPSGVLHCDRNIKWKTTLTQMTYSSIQSLDLNNNKVWCARRFCGGFVSRVEEGEEGRESVEATSSQWGRLANTPDASCHLNLGLVKQKKYIQEDEHVLISPKLKVYPGVLLLYCSELSILSTKLSVHQCLHKLILNDKTS